MRAQVADRSPGDERDQDQDDAGGDAVAELDDRL
jgi:hypothetical protein